MNKNDDSLTEQVQSWADRLRTAGLDGIASVLLEASTPIAPLGAQLLYIAQPTLGLFVSAESVGKWARWLETPDGLALLSRELGED